MDHKETRETHLEDCSGIILFWSVPYQDICAFKGSWGIARNMIWLMISINYKREASNQFPYGLVAFSFYKVCYPSEYYILVMGIPSVEQELTMEGYFLNS